MARKLRVIVAGGWYPAVNPEDHREPISRTDTDRRRFLGRLAKLPERFRLEIHAFVLMNNHYHLLRRIQDAHLSEAIRWLRVSYSSVFDWTHRVRGHLLQKGIHRVGVEAFHVQRSMSGLAPIARCYCTLKESKPRAGFPGVTHPHLTIGTDALRLTPVC